MMNRGELSHKEQYQHLFEFIAKNTKIHDMLEALEVDSPQVNSLLQAINDGDFNAEIFSDNHAHAYLLYLIKEEKIPFWQGISVYIYLMVLMQYTNKLSLKEADFSYHDDKNVSMERLSINGEMTSEGIEYIANVCQKIREIGIDINQQEFITFCLDLSPVEQWLIKLPIDAKISINKNDLLHIVAINLPFVWPMGKESTFYVIPSSSIIRFILQAISPEPIKMQPIFGRINLKTLERMHREGIHPLPLYSPCVTNNMTEAHKRKSGPFPAWVHDLGHAFWGSMLSNQERTSIFTDYLPQIRRWKLEAINHGDDKLVIYLDRVEGKLIDFDLTPIREFSIPSLRFNEYLEKAFEFNRSIEKPKVYLEKLMFMFLSSYYSNAWNDLDRNRWTRVMTSLIAHYAQEEPSIYQVILALTQMIQRILGNAEGMNWSLDGQMEKGKEIDLVLASLNIKPIENEKICNAIKSAQNEMTLWLGMRQFYLNDLVALIVDQGLNFYPPYISLQNSQLVKNDNIRGALQEAIVKFESAKLNKESVVSVSAGEEGPVVSQHQHGLFNHVQTRVHVQASARIRTGTIRITTERSKQGRSPSDMK